MNDNKHLYQPEGAFEFENGLYFNHERAKEAKAILKKSPDDLRARGHLLGYYSGMNMGRGRHTNPDIFARHLKWFVEHHPRHQTLSTACDCSYYNFKSPKFKDVEQAWFQQVHRNREDITILRHAISFFKKRDPLKAIEYCHIAEKLNDGDGYVLHDLALLYLDEPGKQTEATDYLVKGVTLWSQSKDDDSFLDDDFDMPIVIFATIVGEDDSTNLRRIADLFLFREELERQRFGPDITKQRLDAYAESKRLGLAFLARADLMDGKFDLADSLFDKYLDERDWSDESNILNDFGNIILSFSTNLQFVEHVQGLHRKISTRLKSARRKNSKEEINSLQKRKSAIKFWLSKVGKPNFGP